MSNNGVHPAAFRPRPTFPDDLSKDNAIPGRVDPLDLPHPGAGMRLSVSRFYSLFAIFRGRASRSEYWWVVLVFGVIFSALGTLSFGSGAVATRYIDGVLQLSYRPSPLVFIAAALAVANIVPWIALSVRRLHDTNRSGLLVFIALIPVIGTLALLVISARPSNPEGARFDRVRPVYPSDLHPSDYVPPAAVGPSAYRKLEQNSGGL